MVLPTKLALVNKEGYLYIAIFAIVFLLSFLTHWLFVTLSFLLLIWAIAFFRDPVRTILQSDNLLLSPADGRIVYCGLINKGGKSAKKNTNKSKNSKKVSNKETWLDLELNKVSIFMNVFNVHVNRTPASGKIIDRLYFPGKFFNASLDKASTKNERLCFKLQTNKNEIIYIVQIAGLVARRIVPFIKVGAKIDQGQRIGMIRFGSRVDLYFPKSYKILVNKDQKVKAGITQIACSPSQKYSMKQI